MANQPRLGSGVVPENRLREQRHHFMATGRHAIPPFPYVEHHIPVNAGRSSLSL